MPSIPIIYYHRKKLVLERKNSWIRHSASAVIEEGEPCCLRSEELAEEKTSLFVSPDL